MANQNLNRLVTLISTQRETLLARWREEVRQLPGAVGLDGPTINDEVPQLLDNLAAALHMGNEDRETNAISAEHSLLRWRAGFDVTEVIALQAWDSIAAHSKGLNVLVSMFQKGRKTTGGRRFLTKNSSTSTVHRTFFLEYRTVITMPQKV
jgi:hypothetical protein